jgi:ribosomal protein S18 acetylase RimI-like enzyme
MFEPVGTHPDFQGQGLGKAVMTEGLRRMQAAACGGRAWSSTLAMWPHVRCIRHWGFGHRALLWGIAKRYEWLVMRCSTTAQKA